MTKKKIQPAYKVIIYVLLVIVAGMLATSISFSLLCLHVSLEP